jgi:predicted membrane chloride channel (bestrophin family)
VQALLAPTSVCFAQTLAVGAYATAHPAGWPELPHVGQEFFNLTGGALALLLVFRTDASYTRWDEARQQWGEFIFNGRSLLRHGLQAQFPAPPAVSIGNDGTTTTTACTATSAAEGEALKCALVKWTVAFGVLLKLHLREDAKPDSIARELGAWLCDADVALLSRARHKPNAALAVLSRLVTAVPPAERGALNDALEAFSEALGRCERISRVPIPLSYTRHTSRFLIAWLALLPLGCWTTMGWQALLFAPLTAFLLFGVDQIGVDLENPFAVLPLDVLANKLKLDAADMMALSADVASLVEGATSPAALVPASAAGLAAAAAAAASGAAAAAAGVGVAEERRGSDTA